MDDLQLIAGLRRWADARDMVNQRPDRKGRPLDSTLLRQAADRLEYLLQLKRTWEATTDARSNSPDKS